MSSAFERLQKIAEEKRLRERVDKPKFEVVPNSEVNLLKLAPPGTPVPASAGAKQPAAPERDFTKVANSIVRQIPSGIFPGKSKQIYDYLYSLTRGAIKPTRTVRISKAALMRGSGIKSTHTFYNNIRHLEAIELLILTRIDGEQEGNLYEVFVPEEISEDLAQLAQLAQLGQLGQKLLLAPSAETALGALGASPINTVTSRVPKTSLKTRTKNDDDSRANEAFSRMIKKLDSAVKKITGKHTSEQEAEKWESLAELLVLELEVAASRTNGISSVPAFLTEILRRQFFSSKQPNQFSSTKTSKTKIDTVGKTESGSYEIKPLDKNGRESALAELQEFSETDFLQDFKKWYVEEDWNWLMKELRIE
jgi:hypothetical protein